MSGGTQALLAKDSTHSFPPTWFQKERKSLYLSQLLSWSTHRQCTVDQKSRHCIYFTNHTKLKQMEENWLNTRVCAIYLFILKNYTIQGLKKICGARQSKCNPKYQQHSCNLWETSDSYKVTASRKILHLQNIFDRSSLFAMQNCPPKPHVSLWTSITSLILALPQRPPKREVMNEVLSGFSPLVALNPSCYLLHCQPWQWWTQGRQLTTPLFITQKERRKDEACQPSMLHSDL